MIILQTRFSWVPRPPYFAAKFERRKICSALFQFVYLLVSLLCFELKCFNSVHKKKLAPGVLTKYQADSADKKHIIFKWYNAMPKCCVM
jgi:hypothetical protein